MINEEKILDILAGMQDSMLAMRKDMNAHFEAIDTRFDTVDARLEAIDTRFDAMDARLEAMDARFDAVDTRFHAVDTHFQAMDNRMTKLEFKIETDVETKLDALADGHAAIFEQLTPRSRIDDMEREISLLKTLVYQLNGEIQKLKAV